jgi:hypothetical protein
MQYKVVEIPHNLYTLDFAGTSEQAVAEYENFLNSYAAEGWKYQRTANIKAVKTNTVKSGCGKKAKDIETQQKTDVYVAIFIKE